MAMEPNKKVNTTQPKKDQHPNEDTFEQDNNTNLAATPKNDLTVSGHTVEEDEEEKGE
jgi:hypothetical protein